MRFACIEPIDQPAAPVADIVPTSAQCGHVLSFVPRSEQRVADAFVLLTRRLMEASNPGVLLEAAARACVDLFGVRAAGVVLNKGERGALVAASWGREADALQDLQVMADEGPSLDCARTGRAVTIADLDAHRARWPEFVPAALAAGLGSVAALPLGAGQRSIGSLTLFDCADVAFSAENLRLARSIGEMAGSGLLRLEATREANERIDQLQTALTSRIVIEQAKGLLAGRCGLRVDVAFEVLRRYARSNRLKIADAAEAVVGGTLRIDALVSPAVPGGTRRG